MAKLITKGTYSVLKSIDPELETHKNHIKGVLYAAFGQYGRAVGQLAPLVTKDPKKVARIKRIAKILRIGSIILKVVFLTGTIIFVILQSEDFGDKSMVYQRHLHQIEEAKGKVENQHGEQSISDESLNPHYETFKEGTPNVHRSIEREKY